MNNNLNSDFSNYYRQANQGPSGFTQAVYGVGVGSVVGICLGIITLALLVFYFLFLKPVEIAIAKTKKLQVEFQKPDNTEQLNVGKTDQAATTVMVKEFLDTKKAESPELIEKKK